MKRSDLATFCVIISLRLASLPSFTQEKKSPITMSSAKISCPTPFADLKVPTKDALQAPMLHAERAIDSALEQNFDLESCQHLTHSLRDLQLLIIDTGKELPIIISDNQALSSRVLSFIDIAYCCWRNDGAEVELDVDVAMNHVARMKLNPDHCKSVLDLTRLFLQKYDRLLSVESAMLRV